MTTLNWNDGISSREQEFTVDHENSLPCPVLCLPIKEIGMQAKTVILKTNK